MPTTRTQRLRSPLNYYGGKYNLAKSIISQFTPHTTYIEPYCGAAHIYFTKPPSKIEILNDINPDLMNFYHQLQTRPNDIIKVTQRMPHNKKTHTLARKWRTTGPPLQQAIGYLALTRMSFGGRPTEQYFHSKPGGPNQTRVWVNTINNIPLTHNRIKNTILHNQPAIKIIQQYDSQDTLMYLDPPYMIGTRNAPNRYDYEMTDTDHQELLNTILTLKAHILLSGYHHPLYDNLLKNWRHTEYNTYANMGTGKHRTLTHTLNKRTDVLWSNR